MPAMLRISNIESETDVVTLRLEGQIIGDWISELNGVCEQMLTAGRKVTLDLGDVSLIDRPGLALLASLSQRGVALVRCSPFQRRNFDWHHRHNLTQGTNPYGPASNLGRRIFRTCASCRSGSVGG